MCLNKSVFIVHDPRAHVDDYKATVVMSSNMYEHNTELWYKKITRSCWRDVAKDERKLDNTEWKVIQFVI